MIVMFPLLTDETVSPNIIPGVCTALERFALIYKLDEILRWGGLPLDSRIISYGKDIASIATRAAGGPTALFGAPMTEGAISEYEADKHKSDLYNSAMEKGLDLMDPISAGVKATKAVIDTGLSIEKTIRDRKKEKFEKEKELLRVPERKIDVKAIDIKSNLSVEPTWITTQSRKGTAVLGVKVVPYPIDSTAFVHRIVRDMSLSFYDEVLERYERGITRMFYTVMRKLPIFRSINIKKDPFSDIIYARSKYKGNIFTLFNLASLQDESIFREAGGVDKLFRLGWNSILISDDVTKRVVFCMKEFGGMCSVINYSYVYASIGSEYAKEYGNLEDLKKSSSPFFKTKIRPARVFAESLSAQILERFNGLSIPCIEGDCKE